MAAERFTDLFSPTFLRQLESRCIQIRRPVWGGPPGGEHLDNRRGTSIEFADYQAYQPGDDFRYIDWNLYGRTDRLYVKMFKADVALVVHVLVDASASMGEPRADQKSRYAMRIALALAYVALSGQNRVRVALLGGTTPRSVRHTPFYGRRDQVVHLYRFLNEMQTGGAPYFPETVEAYLHGARSQGGTVILITDGLMEPRDFRRGIQQLMFRNYDVHVVQVLGGREWAMEWGVSGPVTAIDTETGQECPVTLTAAARRSVRAALQQHVVELRQFCRRRGATHTLAVTDQSLEELILKTFPTMGLIR